MSVIMNNIIIIIININNIIINNINIIGRLLSIKKNDL